ncbi:HAD domain-containing protein [Noviherbaspirillum sp.]|uniref:HAD domain-containing protein n=1 Tax=Noviherbaspirillum sp. TaxID=1926288 RepID=UPI002D258D1A|nr:HAD domain-containing protein [Noviherbaspirillum sp.]HZW21383.1 HAD domain-containing protein [Noviherbaspirillum sp.]
MLLFLGFDGVMHPARGERTLFEHRAALEALLREHTHVEVVITSSWREVFDTDSLREDYFSRDLQPRIIDVTPLIPGAMRWQEVQAYLDETRYGGPYIVVDDDATEFPAGWAPLLLCDSAVGLDAGKCAELAARMMQRPQGI